MKIETIEVAGFAPVFEALRLPFGKEPRTICNIHKDEFYERVPGRTERYNEQALSIDNADLKLLNTLVRRGDEHAKAVRGIVAYAKITAPVYWWVEEETYRIGHERLASESTMHIDCKGLSGDELVKAKAAIPMGRELTKVDMFSYQCLRNICRQREGHRLPEWKVFIDWVRTLPLAGELIFADNDNN